MRISAIEVLFMDAIGNKIFYDNKVVIKVVSLNTGLENFFSSVRKLERKKDVVQLFDPERIVDKWHLLGAYLNALLSFREHTNISNSVGTEMLLFAAMTRQIGDAIKAVGAKTDERALLFATRRGYVKVKKYFGREAEFRVSEEHRTGVAAGLGVKTDGDIGLELLNRMSFLKLEI